MNKRRNRYKKKQEKDYRGGGKERKQKMEGEKRHMRSE